MCSHLHVILHMSEKFRSNRTELWRHIDFYDGGHRVGNLLPVQVWWLHLFREVEIYLHTKFRWDISIIHIKLLPVSKNGQPPYWNSVSSFNVDLIFIIIVSLCIDLQNFVKIEPPGRRSYDHIPISSRWRLAALFIWSMLDQPTKCNIVRLSVVLKFGLHWIGTVWDIAIFLFQCFGLKLPLFTPIFLGGAYSPNSWWRGTVVERRSLAGELSLSCARPASDEWPVV